MADTIPLVDISDISLLRNDDEIDDITLRKVGAEIKAAFSTYGFCYFTNHGISQDLTDRLMTVSQQYFNRPTDEKMKAKYGKVQPFMGWVGLECEALNLSRPCDYREGFNYHAVFDNLQLLPAEFLEANKEVFTKCLALVVWLIDALSVAMVVDRKILRNALNSVRRKENSTCIRSIYYPPYKRTLC